jgi:hypothetical protein
MVEHLPLAEGFDVLAQERARQREGRERRRRALRRAIPWLARMALGVLPVVFGWLFWAWAMIQWPLEAERILTLALISLYAAFVALSLLLHSDLARFGRRTATFALGLAIGLVLALLPRVLTSWQEALEMALELPVLLVLGLTQDPLRASLAAGMSLWTLGPLSVTLVCAWDAMRAIRRLRGSSFDFRDSRWILLGLLLGFASIFASAFWPGLGADTVDSG